MCIRDRFNHKNWGRIKIKLELLKRKISTKNIEIGLNELDHEKYLEKLDELFSRKIEKHSFKIDIYSKKKIFNYFNYRGWEKDLIFKKLNSLNEKK